MKFNSIILQYVARILSFFINIYAIYLMLQGHNYPGGGFIAGLVTAISLVMLNLAVGIDEVKRILRVDPVFIAVVGLAMAYSTSLLPVFFGADFLKHSFIHLHNIPLLGDLHLGTPLLFDMGVYLVVIGVTCKIIVTYSYLVYDRKNYFLEETLLYSSKQDTSTETEGEED
jgi:multicomponent Na+:H+ antiporter subunit B